MNILFLTLVDINDISVQGGYPDLLREFVKNGHNLYIIKPFERRSRKKTQLISKDNVSILSVKTLNIQKTNFIEKGIGTILIEYQFLNALQKYLGRINFDLVLYSTPPISYVKVLEYLKKQTNCKTYLLLKDIFPQNAVDLELFSKSSLFYKYFRRKEKKLYELSDIIGCMSPANIKYVLKHNSYISGIVELAPNVIEVKEYQQPNKNILKKYCIPKDCTLFIYGGNLGKPQGLNFLLDILKSNKLKKDRFFLIVGSGTEFSKIENWFINNKPVNAKLIKQLPQNEYEELVNASDIGLIFLDPRFTIPNYPSRLLSYLENKKPVICATDSNTDIGSIAVDNGYGWWLRNGNLLHFNSLIDKICHGEFPLEKMGNAGYNFLLNNYTVQHCYKIIMKHFPNV